MPDNHTENSDHVLDLAYLYALDAVSESERRTIVEHLGGVDPHTAREFARIVRGTHETMAIVTETDAVDPPTILRQRIIDAVGDTAGPGDELAARRAMWRRRLTRSVVAAAAAIAIGLGAAVATGQFASHQSNVPTVAEVVSAPDARTVTTTVAGGTITLSASATVNAVVVSMSDVPPPPAGHVYQMWFMPASGAPRSAGTMSAQTMPPPGGEVIPALDSAATVAVTVEPGAGSAQPTRAPVVTIPLA